MDHLTRRSMAVSPVDGSEVSAVTNPVEGPYRRQPLEISLQMSGSSRHVSNLKDLESHYKTQVVGTGLDVKTSLTNKLWHKCRDITRSVCRALGLAIVPHAFRSLRHVTGNGKHEPIKVAIRKSYTIAILRGLIHVLPISFALVEIILNTNTYYIGVSPYNQAVYQSLAKIHEIMIQASLATVILAYVRHELISDNGLPLGALVSGLQISQFAYLWSIEFWGTLRSKTYPISRKLKLLIVILTCFTVAILAGPSSAVLLIPRLDFWPAGSTDIWINATPDDLYPHLLNEDVIPGDCIFAPESSTSNACPSSEWETIQQFLSVLKYSVPEGYEERYSGTEGPSAATLNGKSSQRLLYLRDDLTNEARIAPWFSTTPMAAVADALSTTNYLWLLSLANVTTKSGHGSPLSDQLDAISSLGGDSFQGFSSGTCVPDFIFNRTDNRPLALPLLYYANDPNSADSNITTENFTVPAITHPSLTRDQILGNALDESQYYIQWIATPQERFNGSSIGAAILLPHTWNSSREQSWPQIMIVCNLAAAWGTTSLQMDVGQKGNGDAEVSSKINDQSDWDRKQSMATPTLVASESETDWVNWDYPRYPQNPINITQAWARSLNPVVQSVNKTVFELIMQEKLDLQGRESIWASTSTFKGALTLMISNGLGRVKFNSTLQGSPKSVMAPDGTSWIDGNYWLSGKGNVFTVDPEDAKKWVKFHVDSKLQGYAYNTQTVPPRLAIAVMIIYCVMALSHLLYSAITGITSTCWDSITELTVLAVNSAPTETLRNTCAGIRELHIFQLPVRVVAVPDKEGDGSHLELVFANDETEGDRVKVNRKYGTMSSRSKQS